MKNKILSILKNADNYVSGQKLSSELNVSRSAIWKHIKKLKNEGYNIISVTNRGYRLLDDVDILNANEISDDLKTSFIGQNIVFYDSIGSTNNEAKRNFDSADGTLFIADLQTAGKGRLGRAWQTKKGTAIAMSLLLKPKISPTDVSKITLVAGLSVCRALSDFGAKIKWPNDIVTDGKKICGILTEMSAEINMVNYVVLGIGINVNDTSFPDELKDKATSLYLTSGKKHSRAKIIRKILEEFEILYSKFLKNGLLNIIDEYKKNCVNIGKVSQAVYKDKTIIGTAVDITPDGELVLKTDTETINISTGEVSVRGIYGYV